MEKRFAEQNKEPIPDETPLVDILPIQEGSVDVGSRESLAQVVEAPLLGACQMLYDKGIETLMSSANSNDIRGGNAYIDINYTRLSDENKKIAEELGGRMFKMHGPEPRIVCVKITFPVDTTTTVGDIRKVSIETCSRFVQQ
ncbi:MAG: hypothetical protein RLY57_668 [Candidatus Parcubacteria bacterium]|jgi:hypothetical protein